MYLSRGKERRKIDGVLGVSLQGHPFLPRKKREGLHLRVYHIQWHLADGYAILCHQ